MWGTQVIKLDAHAAGGITPTCVGNTGCTHARLHRCWDHPHLCGEHYTRPALGSFLKGSPPPVWGTQLWANELATKLGITPTCVGNTSQAWAGWRSGRDHPHLCGEHCLSSPVELIARGSPPPVWGTHKRISSIKTPTGITPTCVGNTPKRLHRSQSKRDHPHLCGEHSKTLAYGLGGKGSPPPVWGTQSGPQKMKKCARITPTCVGNTRGPRSPPSR